MQGLEKMLTLSWPDSALSPNSRCHWSVRAKAAKAARKAAWWATKASGDRVEGNGKIDLYVVFYPPDKRRYDLDNRIASIKSVLDGVADGLQVDDSRFRLICEMGGIIKGGEVRIIITG